MSSDEEPALLHNNFTVKIDEYKRVDFWVKLILHLLVLCWSISSTAEQLDIKSTSFIFYRIFTAALLIFSCAVIVLLSVSLTKIKNFAKGCDS